MMIDAGNKNDDFDDLENDDFEGIDDDAFDDFDDTQKGSLKELWQSNPLLKLGVVAVGIVVVIVAIFIFGGGDQTQESVVKKGANDRQLPGESQLSPDMEQRIEEKNEFDFRIAEATGGSQIPISTNVPQQGLSPEEQERQLQEDDPLAIWRSEALTREEEVPEPQPEVVQPVRPAQMAPPPSPQPNPEMVNALSLGFGAQMRQILESQTIEGSRHMMVTTDLEPYRINTATVGEDVADAQNNGADGAAMMPDILVEAGEVLYAQTLIEANTDAPGPVLARILSGPLKGSRALGGFAETEDYLTITFDRVVYKGRVVDVDAIAIDADTTLPGVATEVNNRYFKRVVLPAAAAFVEGFGSAVAESGSTSVSVEGETVTTENEDLDTRQELLSGVEEATEVIAEFMEEEADRTRPMIKVAAGTPIGIMFIDEVEDPASVPAMTDNDNQ